LRTRLRIFGGPLGSTVAPPQRFARSLGRRRLYTATGRQAAATSIRGKENEEFVAAEKELVEAVDMLARAHTVLSREMKDVSLSMLQGGNKKMVAEKNQDVVNAVKALSAIVNAAYFKGQWLSQFKPKDTKFGNFYIKRDQIRMVKFMVQKGSFNYYVSEELQAHVLELPYEGDHVSMVIILPPWQDDSLQETVRRMTPETLQGVMAEISTGFYKVEKLDVLIPKFSISGSLELREPLGQLGINSLFGGQSNLTGFLDQYDSEDTVSLDSAKHKSFIEVNEEGSEAAAATALLGFRSARPLFHSEFKADHPFMFLIYDKQVDTVLFFGVYQHPPAP